MHTSAHCVLAVLGGAVHTVLEELGSACHILLDLFLQ